MNEYPSWVCWDCGTKASQVKEHQGGVATYHMGICEVCKESKAVTQPRDFGYPKFTSPTPKELMHFAQLRGDRHDRRRRGRRIFRRSFPGVGVDHTGKLVYRSRSPLKPIHPNEPQYGPRGWDSNFWISSMQRIFGQPVIVPPGKQA